MPKIAVWYHGLFSFGNPRVFLPSAFSIVEQAMRLLEVSGLTEAATEIWTCFNGSEEEADYAKLIVPQKANIVMHGLSSFAENLTICKLHEWAATHQEFYVLYFHSKCATHDPESGYARGTCIPWRETMLFDLVVNWKQCVADLDQGYELCCSHFMRNMGSDQSQHIPAGNFLWITGRFAASLPSIYLRDRIRVSGIASPESRFEAEVFWGNGARLPQVKEYRPGGGAGVP